MENRVPPPDSDRITLNANQRRHFEVVFTGLEATVGKIESLADGSAGDGRFASAVDDLPHGFAAAANDVFARVRQRLAALADRLDLKPRLVSRRHTCRALLTSEMIRLEESYAQRLRGYGAVDDSLAASLDPILKEIRDDLSQLAALLRESGPPKPR